MKSGGGSDCSRMSSSSRTIVTCSVSASPDARSAATAFGSTLAPPGVAAEAAMVVNPALAPTQTFRSLTLFSPFSARFSNSRRWLREFGS